MKYAIYLFIAAFIFTGRILAQESRSDTLFVATWNLENLFDTTNDAGKRDGEFTPESRIQWTQTRLDIKLSHLARVINAMNNGNGPDILGVVEVEHRSLLDSLINRYMNKPYYKTAYKESPDNRGIDNGIIYNSRKLKLLEAVGDTVTLPDKYPTRLILNANFLYNGRDTLVVFENHWPARLGGVNKTEPNRIAAAKALKRLVKGYLDKNPRAKIIIMGDFNDEPANKSVSGILSADSSVCTGKNGHNESGLFNLAYKDYSLNMGSYKYRNNWDMLDQIIVSSALAGKSDLRYICGSFRIYKPEYMITKSGKYKGTPFPTYGGRRYLGGYSDHFPVTAEFTAERR